MGDWPTSTGSRIDVYGESLAVSSGLTMTSGATNTKGVWLQLEASTPFSCSGFLVTINNATAASLTDIGIGADGSEQVLVPDIHTASLTLTPYSAYFPVHIPAGVRVASRFASATASSTASITLYPLSRGFDGLSARSLVTAYGVNSGTSRGTSVDPGGTLHTKGAWAPLSTSTTAVIKELILGSGNQGNATATGATWLVDVGVGAASSEQVVVPNWRISASVNETVAPQASYPFPVDIPVGSRLSVRSQCNLIDATDRLLDFVIHGIS